MSKAPRDPALAAIFRATVRVADGSGVVIRNGKTVLVATAAHVVRGGEVHAVRKGGVFSDCPVVSRNVVLDLALITPPIELESTALHIAGDAAEALPGDAVWAAGFPRGWKGSDPVIAAGTIAAIGEESWVNLDGTWGNSGGPICRIVNGGALVTGILLGNASEASQALDDWTKTFGTEAGEHRAGLEGLKERRTALTKEVIAEMVKPLKVDSLAGRLDLGSVAVQVRLLASLHSLGSAALAKLIDQHFRTGFLRFAPVADLRNLLDPGDGRPSL